MTSNTSSTYPLTRRTVLKTAAAAGAISAFGVTGSGFVGRAAATEDTVINTCGDLDIVLALDYSGSINGAGTWPDIQSGTESFFEIVPEDVQLGMVLFGDAPDARPYGASNYLDFATTANIATIQDEIPANSPPQENGTHMPGALTFADAILDEEGRDGNEVIILVTDGGPNYQNGVVGDGAFPPEDDTTFPYGSFDFTGGSAGGDGNITQSELDETEGVATDIKSGGVRIIAVGIGQNVAGFDDYLENNVASSPDDFVAVEDAENLGAELQQLLTEICDECVPCESDDLLAKYEYEYGVDEETGEVLVDTFEPEFETENFSFVSYEGEQGEPMSATFTTDYCSVWAVVKSGQEFEVQGFVDNDGTITVDTANDEKYAISFVAFFCNENAAEEFAESFPSRGRGGGRPE